MINHILTKKLEQLPSLPGCYMYKNKDGKILYVGKAKILKNRVRSYFANFRDLAPKIQHMLYNAVDIEWFTVDTEFEALILEANLIKKYHPSYNTMLMDDKKYAWIKVTMQDDFPGIYRVREKKNDGAKYFGPYPSVDARDKVLKFLRKEFPFRSCNLTILEEKRPKRSRLCIFYHLNLCSGPCDHLISKKDYRKNILNITRFLEGKKNSIFDDLEKQMKKASAEEDFESAAKLRDQLNTMKFFMQKIKLDYGDDEFVAKKIIQKGSQEGLNELIKALKKRGFEFENEEDFRMECYDISNIQGKFPVGSMVIFENGVKVSSDYRKFKVVSMDTPNDFKMMMEILGRRLKYLLPDADRDIKKNVSFNKKPSLIIIDGGKGQLSAARKVVDELGLNIAVVGLAKRMEELWLPNDSKPIIFNENSQAKYLIQRIRDEAHRFAITYHRLLRSKGMFANEKGEELVTQMNKSKKWKEFLKK